jgi:hypothetical protein
VRESCKQLPEKPSRESLKVLKILRSQQRQRPLPFAGERLGRFAEVVEESGEIGVTWIKLILDSLDASRIQPTGYQRSFSGTRRTHYAYRGLVFPCFIEHCEQAFSRHGFVQARARELGKLRRGSGHDPNPEDCPT